MLFTVLTLCGASQKTMRVRYTNYLSSYLRNKNTSNTAPVQKQELKIPILGGHIAAKAWGSPSGFPVLMLHGWLDNCGTFDRLVPLLTQSFYFVAVDLSGHGLSSHKPAGGCYGFLDVIVDIKRVLNFFSWTKIHMITHSTEGEIALLFASIYNKVIDKLVLLDITKPYYGHDNELIHHAKSFVNCHLTVEDKLSQPPPEYTHDDAIKRLVKGMHNEITVESASVLLTRGSKVCPNGKRIFTRDLKLQNFKSYSAVSFKIAQAFISHLECEMLLVSCENRGSCFTLKPEDDKLFIDIYKKHCKRFIVEKIKGNHFAHLNDPMRVSPIINSFLDTWKISIVRIRYINYLSSFLRNKNTSSTASVQKQELKIPIPGGHIAAKAWGSPSGFPVLMLHGWLNNCGTFDRLVPLLTQSFYFVAVDLPGHGLSSHKPPGCCYSYRDMICSIKHVLNFFSWSKSHVIAHSMGGEIALLYGSIYNKIIDKLVLLDVCKPYYCYDNEVIQYAKSFIDGHLITEDKMSKPPPEYTHDDAMIRLVKGMHNEITLESASVLLKRGSKVCPNGKMIFTRDLRLRNIEAYSVVSYKTAQAFLSHLKCEMLFVSCENRGSNYTSKPEDDALFIDIYKKHCKRFIMEKIEGNHFAHLNDPMRVSPIINSFLDT